jgi:hypothetical protein
MPIGRWLAVIALALFSTAARSGETSRVHPFCALIAANRPAGSSSCTASLNKADAFRMNVIVTEQARGSQVMLVRTDLPPGGSCGTNTFSGLCADLDSEAPIAFAQACSANDRSETFGCNGLYWMQRSAPGLVALTPAAENLINLAASLQAGDRNVVVVADVAAFVGESEALDEASIRMERVSEKSHQIVLPKSSAVRSNIVAAIKSLSSTGLDLPQLLLFGEQGRIVFEREGQEFFLDPSCMGCGSKRLMTESEFVAEYRRRFALVPVEEKAEGDIVTLRRVLMSALVTPGFRASDLEAIGALQDPSIYLLEP